MVDDDTIEFQGRIINEAIEYIEEIQEREIKVSKLARSGLRDKLQETITADERICIYNKYENDEITKEVTEILLGEDLNDIQKENSHSTEENEQ